jgi:archaellum component FlaC
MAKSKKTISHGHFVRFAPEEPTIQDALDEIGDLKGMLGNALDEIAAIKKSIAELKREVSDLSDQIDQ